MKTTQFIFSLLVATGILLFSCNKSQLDEIQPAPDEPLNEEISFRSNLHFDQQHNVVNAEGINHFVKLNLKTNGVSTTVKLQQFDIELSHEAFYMDIRSVVKIDKGELVIRGTNGDKLFGKYSGYAQLDDDPTVLKLIIRITGGTGYFAGASGYLNGNGIINDWRRELRDFDWRHELGDIELEGIIVRKKLLVT